MKQVISFLLVLICSEGNSQKMLMFKDAIIPHPIIKQDIISWNSNQAGYNALSLKEQQFYYWVNYSRSNPAIFFDSAVVPIVKVYPQLEGSNFTSLKKDMENAQPLSMLYLNAQLNKMSIAHAIDITSNDAMPSHNSTNGETFADRYRKYHLKSCAGENISYGGQDSDPLFMLVLLYLDINVPDLGHRKALLNPGYVITGIGVSSYKNGNTFIVEDFACSQN